MVRKPLWFLFVLWLAALAALAAAAPPNLVKALEAQRQLTEKRPQDAGVWNDYGNLLMLARRTSDAEAAYRRAVELDPKKSSALFNLGLFEQQQGHRKEAQALFEQVIQNDPDHAWAWYQIGTLHEAAKRESRAIAAYSRAFALDPQLAFPDVNPQVVESKLVTQAMLKAYREGAKAPEAPKVYDDPGRIAGLLVPTPAPERTEVAGKPDAKKPAAPAAPAPAPKGVGVPGVGVPGVGVPGAAQKGTVLREGTIERGSPVGQALPPGQTRRTPPPPSRGTRPGGVATPQPWTRPSTNVDEDEEEGTYVPPPQPPPPPPAGVIYQPGLPSSGRLDVRLIPGRPAHRPDRIAALAAGRTRG